jgi:ribosomal protein L10
MNTEDQALDELVDRSLDMVFSNADPEEVSKMLNAVRDAFVRQPNCHVVIALAYIMVWLMENAPEGEGGLVPLLVTTIAARQFAENQEDTVH